MAAGSSPRCWLSPTLPPGRNLKLLLLWHHHGRPRRPRPDCASTISGKGTVQTPSIICIFLLLSLVPRPPLEEMPPIQPPCPPFSNLSVLFLQTTGVLPFDFRISRIFTIMFLRILFSFKLVACLHVPLFVFSTGTYPPAPTRHWLMEEGDAGSVTKKRLPNHLQCCGDQFPLFPAVVFYHIVVWP